MNSQPTLGLILGVPAAGLLALVLIAGSVYLLLLREYEWSAGFGATALAVIAISAIALFPYHMEYHEYRPTAGVIASVNSRLLGDSKSTTQNFVVEFTDGRIRRCDDSRCAVLKPGDTLTLMCVREYDYGSTDGYDCKFRSSSSGSHVIPV